MTNGETATRGWQSARIPYLRKLDEIGTEAKLDEIEGQK